MMAYLYFKYIKDCFMLCVFNSATLLFQSTQQRYELTSQLRNVAEFIKFSFLSHECNYD